MGEKICHIVGAAEVRSLSIKRRAGDLVVAVDGGYAHLKKFSIPHDVAIGDFDSLGFTPKGDRVYASPAEKDDTDTVLAIRYGLTSGYRRFALYGCLGGALSHTLANLQALAFLQKNEANGVLIGEDTAVLLLKNGALPVSLPLNLKMSIFAFGGDARGVTLRGFQYPLTEATLSVHNPVGVSNRPIEPDARIEVREGVLAVVLEGDMRDPLHLLL